jgi:methyl-accepting chemotaxis protein
MTTPRPLALALLLLAGPAGAQAPATAAPRLNPALLGDSLTAQEREMLTVAQDFSRRSAEVLEGWLARNEVSPDRLFAFLYYPVPKTDPPKFTTDWDQLADRDVQAVEEGALGKSPALIYAVLVDRQGYLPTHNLRYSMPLTGNLGNDLVNNRTKRIFNDRTGLAAARSEAPFLIQKYQRDTGETMVDLSVPVFVRGLHWGAVRLGYRQTEAR